MTENQNPDYATAELVDMLSELTPMQRGAVLRIVQHVYIDNLPMSHLFRGEDRICAQQKYYQRGKVDEETGKWIQRPGWHHDKDFQAALNKAAKLALHARTSEEIHQLQQARRRARLAAPAVIGELTSIATGKQLDGNQVISRNSDDKDRINAGKVLLDYAGVAIPEEAQQAGASDETDWWKAAGE